MKKIIFCLFLFSLTQNTFAIICPTVKELKLGLLNGWQPATLDDAEPVSGKRLTHYYQKVRAFAFAGWLSDAPEGSAECFYKGDESDYTYLGIFWVRSKLAADIYSPYWKKSSGYQWTCTAETNKCNFLP